MMLSDKLLVIGLESNPRNNQSMGEAAQRMQKEISLAQSSHTAKQLINIVAFVCNELNRMGFKWFNCDRVNTLQS